MYQRRVHHVAYRSLNIAQWVAGFFAAAIAASVETPVDRLSEYSEGAASIVEAIQDIAWFITPLLVLAVGVFQLARRIIGPPWVWEAVHRVLDQFRDLVYQHLDVQQVDHHRVTLFRHYSGWSSLLCMRCLARRFPWQGWLVPVERSGHISQRPKIIFRAPDSGDHAEGVAGRAWVHTGVVLIRNLPELSRLSPQAKIVEYAEKTGVKNHWIASRLHSKMVPARSYCGVVVEVGGKPWGVLVLDSRHEDGIREDMLDVYPLTAKVLEPLLERV